MVTNVDEILAQRESEKIREIAGRWVYQYLLINWICGLKGSQG